MKQMEAMMIQNKIFQYVRTLFDESRNGTLTVGSDLDRMDYEVDWNEETAKELAQQCAELVSGLRELAFRTDAPHRNSALTAVFNTYLRPFSDHGLDPDDLRAVLEKEAICLALNKSEQMLFRQYCQWYEENALKRLPWKGCAPTGLIRCARRYARLVELKAPAAVQENEARALAEEFVLYHCRK